MDNRASTPCLSPVIRVTVASLTPRTRAKVRLVHPLSFSRDRISCPGVRNALDSFIGAEFYHIYVIMQIEKNSLTLRIHFHIENVMNKLDIAARAKLLSMLCEGASMRSVSRLADVSINTVSKLLVDAGRFCAGFHDAKVRNVKAKRVQVDEIWCVHRSEAKERRRMKASSLALATHGHGRRSRPQTKLHHLALRRRPGWRMRHVVHG